MGTKLEDGIVDKLPEHVIALISYIRLVIENEYWNKYQESINLQYEKISNDYFTVIPPCTDIDNFKDGSIEFNGIKIHYPHYLSKHMYADHTLTLDEWIKWFEEFIKVVRSPKIHLK